MYALGCGSINTERREGELKGFYRPSDVNTVLSIEKRSDEAVSRLFCCSHPIPKSWPFSSRWRNLDRFEWHLRMRGMSRHPRFLAPPIPFYDPDWWPRCLGIRNMQPSEPSGPHARQPVQFSSLRHISLAKNKFLFVFLLFCLHSFPQKC